MNAKETLHTLVDACADERLVQQAIAFFTEAKEDWWATLSAAEQKNTLLAIHQLDQGLGLAHKDVMDAAWKVVNP